MSNDTIERVPESAPTGSGRPRIPGDPGIWIFVFLDTLIFTEMFAIFTWYRAEYRAEFAVDQTAVVPAFGLVYTLLLLTSSWLVVMAVAAARKGLTELSAKLFRSGIALGGAFALIKLIEYGGKLIAGITPLTSDFFMFYFVMTVVHLLHAVAGLIVLSYVRRQILSTPAGLTPEPRRMTMIETGAVYWHMVDLLWIVLFALFYLGR